MKLAIVMPVLNESGQLASRLRALQALRQRGVCVVVADGGSADASWAEARALADHLVLAPRGRAAQMNAGAQAAAGQADVLLFLHADTVLPPDADRLIARALSGGAVWGRFDVRIDSALGWLRVVSAMMNLRSRVSGIATGDQAMFVTREAFERVGGFSDQPLMEDIDLSRRLKRLGAPACLREQVLTSGRRWEAHGTWRTIVLMWRLRAAYALGASPASLAARYGYGARPEPVAAALGVMAKAPVPGWAKTRLIPACGPAGAARVHRRLAVQTVQMGMASGLRPVTLWCAGELSHRFFRALQRRFGLALRAQPEGDLGARMAHAVAQHFDAHPGLPLLLIGTDCPVLAPGHLQHAATALQTHDVVLIPAEDGGYVLIGMRRPLLSVFNDISWSTDTVMVQTRDRLTALGCTWHEMPTLWDVDEPQDLQRLRRLESGADTPPPTALREPHD